MATLLNLDKGKQLSRKQHFYHLWAESKYKMRDPCVKLVPNNGRPQLKHNKCWLYYPK